MVDELKQLRRWIWSATFATLLAVLSVILVVRAPEDGKPPKTKRSSSASVAASIVPGTISLPARAILEGELLLQTASGAEIVRTRDVTSRAVPGVGAPLDLSPDGSTVLGSTDAGLVAVDVGSGEIRLLVGALGGGVFVSARWSPDGTIVASTTEAADDPAGGSTLCAVTLDPLELTCFPELGRVYSFDWAP